MRLWKNLIQQITRLTAQLVILQQAEPASTSVEDISVSPHSPINLTPLLDNLELLKLYQSMDLSG